jgi:toxin ParE1/3/4
MSRRYRIVWTERALRDLEGVLDSFEAERGLETAADLYGSLDSAIATRLSMPNRCRVVAELREHGIRAYREVLREPYRIVFRVRARDVVLLAVLDHRRDLEEFLLERASEDDLGWALRATAAG